MTNYDEWWNRRTLFESLKTTIAKADVQNILIICAYTFDFACTKCVLNLKCCGNLCNQCGALKIKQLRRDAFKEYIEKIDLDFQKKVLPSIRINVQRIGGTVEMIENLLFIYNRYLSATQLNQILDLFPTNFIDKYSNLPKLLNLLLTFYFSTETGVQIVTNYDKYPCFGKLAATHTYQWNDQFSHMTVSEMKNLLMRGPQRNDPYRTFKIYTFKKQLQSFDEKDHFLFKIIQKSKSYD
jgi:hypothetical protein